MKFIHKLLNANVAKMLEKKKVVLKKMIAYYAMRNDDDKVNTEARAWAKEQIWLITTASSCEKLGRQSRSIGKQLKRRLHDKSFSCDELNKLEESNNCWNLEITDWAIKIPAMQFSPWANE